MVLPFPSARKCGLPAGGPTISVNDGICINGDQPDYKVIAIYPYRYLTLEVEKL